MIARGGWGYDWGMTTLPNDPPVDDDDWSHDLTAGQEDVLPDPDDLEAFSEEDLDDLDDLEDEVAPDPGEGDDYPRLPPD